VKSHVVVAALLVAALGTAALAQERPAPPQPPGPSAVPVKLQVVLSRQQGEKKISSLPYTLSVSPDERNRSNAGRASLRLGAQVPIIAQGRAPDAGSPAPTVHYRDIGTSIDCMVWAFEDGRFKVELTIEDSSIDSAPGSAANLSQPAFRSFRSSDTLILRDGQTTQFSTATDKTSGEVWRVDVTLTVLK
jgi:hypothetical protein